MKKYSYLALATYCSIHSLIAIIIGLAIPVFVVFLIANLFLLGFQIWYLLFFENYEEVEAKIKAQDREEKEELQNFLKQNN